MTEQRYKAVLALIGEGRTGLPAIRRELLGRCSKALRSKMAMSSATARARTREGAVTRLVDRAWPIQTDMRNSGDSCLG